MIKLGLILQLTIHMLIQDLSITRNTRNYCNFATLISCPNFFPARESESPKPVVELSLVNELDFSSEDEDDERDKGNTIPRLNKHPPTT